VVGGLGFGPVVLAPLARWLIDSPGVMTMFKVFGVGAFVLMGFAAWFVRNPPEGYCPAGFTPKMADGTGAAAGLTWTEMLVRPRFWLLYATFIAGSSPGYLLNSVAKDVALELGSFSPSRATATVVVFALGSACGRVLWGVVSDGLGRMPTLALLGFLSTGAMAVLGWMPGPEVIFPCVAVVGLCFGGVLGTFPSLCAETFGTKYAAANYGWLFSATAVAVLTAPRFVEWFGMLNAFHVGAMIAAAGMLLAGGMVLVLWKRAGDGR